MSASSQIHRCFDGQNVKPVCVTVCVSMCMCVWDGERMCWALLAADLEEFASLDGIDAFGFFCWVCV